LATTQFPPGTTSEDRLPSVSSLCSFGWKPHIMSGFLVQLLRQYFADPNNVMDAAVRGKLTTLGGGWKPADNTPVLIETVSRWDPTKLGKRPALIVKRNSWRQQSLGLGDELKGFASLDGARAFTTMWLGSHTIFMLAGEGTETERWASEAGGLLLKFSPLIRDQLGLFAFKLIEVGALGKIEECAEHYAVPLSLAYAATEDWTLQPFAPLLKKVVFNFDSMI
jgi:hypothetical protein